MDTRQLRAFLRIVETGSISRAAQSLGIAQPSLSQQLLRLEDELGVTLFRRTARGVTPTDAGRLYVEHARELLRRAERAAEDVRHLRADVGGEVILALPPSLCAVAGMALLEAFAARLPRVRLRLVEALTGQIRGWLEAGKIDLGVMHELGTHRDLSARRLAREELMLAGPPGLPAVVAAKALAGLPLVAFGPQHGLRQVIEHEAARAGISLTVALDLDAARWIVPLVAAGHHAVVPRSLVADGMRVARIGDAGWWRTLALMRNAGEIVTHASLRGEELVARVLGELITRGDWVAQAA